MRKKTLDGRTPSSAQPRDSAAHAAPADDGVRRSSRRTFARVVVIVAGAAAVMPNLIAQTPPPSPQPPLPPASQTEVDARVQWIFNKYGSRLNDAQRADIRRLIAGGQPSIDAMRAYPLDNSVGPAK